MKYNVPSYIKDLGLTRCFICNTLLRSNNYTLEHLIPQWIIRRFDLVNHSITLTYDITVPYMDFVVPCCRECNCHLLAPLEARLCRTITQSSTQSSDIVLDDLAIWSCKIFSGLRLFDTATAPPKKNSRKKSPRKIAPDALCQFYLRMLRGSVRINHLMLPFPFTAFIFQMKLPRKKTERFDFQIAKDLSAMYIRIGKWAILSRFDGGYLALYGTSFFEPYFNRRLAPLQIEELAAHFFTMAGRQAYPLLYLLRNNDGIDELEYIPVTVKYPFTNLSTTDDFFYWFSYLTRTSAETLRMGTGCRTFLKNAHGRFLNIPADRNKCFSY